ncbi:MAG: PhzF family phenazine biosynthesis protein [Eudoraea sp.]|nr:PhzF family phenazine biosynthesis protein [Eudoraea sp.]
MKQKIFQIDAFAENVFSGNPAAVCVLNDWLDTIVMQQIAMENNLAETAFVLPSGKQFEIRWFTPEIEVDLCGHATLAAAYVLFQYYDDIPNPIEFYSPRSGKLIVHNGKDGHIIMDFPKDASRNVSAVTSINKAIGATPIKTIKGKTDYLLIFSTQKEIEDIRPNFHLLNQLDCRGIIISAPGDDVDFVSRFFAPQCGIPEDPVTGSAHTTLTPYWAEVLGKTKLTARQLSSRGGDLICEYMGERIKISGKAVPYLIGEIEI